MGFPDITGDLSFSGSNKAGGNDTITITCDVTGGGPSSSDPEYDVEWQPVVYQLLGFAIDPETGQYDATKPIWSGPLPGDLFDDWGALAAADPLDVEGETDYQNNILKYQPSGFYKGKFCFKYKNYYGPGPNDWTWDYVIIDLWSGEISRTPPGAKPGWFDIDPIE